MAALLYRMDWEKISQCALRLKFSKASRKFIETVFVNANRPLPAGRAEMRRLLGELGEETGAALIELRSADLRAMCHLVIQQGDCLTTKQLNVTGEELYQAGVSRKKTAQCFDFLLNEVIEDRLPNEREALLEAAHAAFHREEPQPSAKHKKRRKKTPSAEVENGAGLQPAAVPPME